MRVVVDTNVLVSATLNPYGIPAEIVRMILVEKLTLCYDARILQEYRDVLLRPKFRFQAEHVDALLEQIRFAGELTAAVPLAKPLPDPHDEAFLEIAIAGEVGCLITGNLRHYPLGDRQDVRVISPKDFLQQNRRHLF